MLDRVNPYKVFVVAKKYRLKSTRMNVVRSPFPKDSVGMIPVVLTRQKKRRMLPMLKIVVVTYKKTRLTRIFTRRSPFKELLIRMKTRHRIWVTNINEQHKN